MCSKFEFRGVTVRVKVSELTTTLRRVNGDFGITSDTLRQTLERW